MAAAHINVSKEAASLKMCNFFGIGFCVFGEDDVSNEDWIRHRMVCYYRSAVTVTFGAGCHRCRSLDANTGKFGSDREL
jgi:hypothetical protein